MWRRSLISIPDSISGELFSEHPRNSSVSIRDIFGSRRFCSDKILRVGGISNSHIYICLDVTYPLKHNKRIQKVRERNVFFTAKLTSPFTHSLTQTAQIPSILIDNLNFLHVVQSRFLFTISTNEGNILMIAAKKKCQLFVKLKRTDN